jgi:hypothetical protein
MCEARSNSLRASPDISTPPTGFPVPNEITLSAASLNQRFLGRARDIRSSFHQPDVGRVVVFVGLLYQRHALEESGSAGNVERAEGIAEAVIVIIAAADSAAGRPNQSAGNGFFRTQIVLPPSFNGSASLFSNGRSRGRSSRGRC